jgi:hypothetical protein
MPPVLAEAERLAVGQVWMDRKGGRLQLEYPPCKQVFLILQVCGMPFSRHGIIELGDHLVGVYYWWAAITHLGGRAVSGALSMPLPL